LVLGDTEDWNNVLGQWDNEWPLDTWVDTPIFRWLRNPFLQILFKEPADYPKREKEEASNEEILHEPESNQCFFPSAPPTQQAVLLCPLPGQVSHVMWRLTKFFVDHLDIFYMYAEMGNNECTEMQHKFQDSLNHSVFVTIPKVCGTGLNLTAANHVAIS
jgi:hypothetical protein